MKKITALLFLFLILSSNTAVFAAERDLTEPSGYSAEELSKGLLYELCALSEEFIAAEEKYGVNAIFLCSVAALESGWGKYCFRPNNIFGWSGKSFESKAECIDFVASKLMENYLSEDGKYYNGKTVSGVNVFYNGNSFWEDKITEIMALIERRISSAEKG